MLNKKKIYAGVFLTVFGICLFGFIWSWIVTKDIRSNSVSDEVKNRRVTVGNLVLTETKDEKVYWELYAKKGSYEASPRFCEMYEEKYFILALAKKKKKTFLSLIMRQNLITFPLRTNADLFQYIKMLCCRNGRSYVFSESSIFLLNYIINNSSKYFNQGLWWFIYL